MAIVRWSDRVSQWRPTRGCRRSTSIQNGDQEVVLKAELPDMTREDIDITVDNGTLTIKGEKKFAGDVKEEQFHRVERRYGTFSRSFSLPQTVDSTQVVGRVQERRAHRAAAAARRGQAAADQGRRRGVSGSGRSGSWTVRAGGAGTAGGDGTAWLAYGQHPAGPASLARPTCPLLCVLG